MLKVVSVGTHTRLLPILSDALSGVSHTVLTPENLSGASLSHARILFAVSLNAYGLADGTDALMRFLRSGLNPVSGSVSSILVDGEGELYTKEYARTLALALSMAGSTLPPRPLVEATGSLQNFSVVAENYATSLKSAYSLSARELVARLLSFQPERVKRPRVLFLHASDKALSNTMSLGAEVQRRLLPDCACEMLSLLSGPIHDCFGCGFKACLHYAEQQTCYYGGFLPDEVFPALVDADALVMLCPNYNDAVSANHMALINRLNALLLRTAAAKSRRLFAIVASGYSGGDIVSKQLLGALCLNKPFILPPHFCLFVTANRPGDAMRQADIHFRLDAFAENIKNALLPGSAD